MEDKLKDIIDKHLNKILKFNPFANYPNIKSNTDFIEVIAKDPAFSPFFLNREKYVIARFGGNLITSLHRKLGDLYEDMVKEILSQTLGVERKSLEYYLELKINNEIQRRSTDGRIILAEIKNASLKERVKNNIKDNAMGLALEVRSCYQIGDSKRIQADRDMALALKELSLEPVMLIFCETSLKSPIIRLKQYWELKEGEKAFDYLKNLTGFDLQNFLKSNSNMIKALMDKVFKLF